MRFNLNRIGRYIWLTPTGAAALLSGLALLILAVLGPILWGDLAHRVDLIEANAGPSSDHWLGTDRLGRDVLARALSATRLSLTLALAAAAIAAGVGIPLGAAVSLLGPRARSICWRVIDSLLAFPTLLVAIFFAAIVGVGAPGAVIGIGIALTPPFARQTSILAASVTGREYVASARVLGIGRWRLLGRYLLPNVADSMVILAFEVASASLIGIAAMSFLGLGVQPPIFDWGRMLIEGVQDLYLSPFAAIAPATMLTLTGLSLGLLGESIARAMNPLLRSVVGQGNRLTADARAPLPARPSQTSLASDCDERKVHVPPLLEVEGLTVSLTTARQSLVPVEDVSFTVGEGEMVGIVGESGSGKTLTALAIAQLAPSYATVTARSMKFHGDDLLNLAPKRLRSLLGRELAFVFQDPMSSLNPLMKVGPQLIEAAQFHRSLSRQAAVERAVQSMREVNLSAPEARLKQHPYEFSGGMVQRAMIAMALTHAPSLIVADEPTTALDLTVQAQIIDVLKTINRTHGTAVIIISHDMGLISEVCSRVLVMYAGHIVEDTPIETMLSGAAHPYTQALMACVVDLTTDPLRPVASIPGEPPSLSSPVRGCPYAPRCPVARELCWGERPELEHLTPDHRVACWVAMGVGAKEEGAK